MGQLDEAIRAHLELKRRHGASEEELHAEEQEALGPVRREPPPDAPEVADDALPEPDAGQEAEAYHGPLAAEPPTYVEQLDEVPPEGFHEPVDPFSEQGFDEPVETAGGGTETVEFSEGLEEPEPDGGDTPPRGFDAVEEPAAEGDEEDVLEETPDFLQETPEHDRLWFEQKPPRDFDFDE